MCVAGVGWPSPPGMASRITPSAVGRPRLMVWPWCLSSVHSSAGLRQQGPILVWARACDSWFPQRAERHFRRAIQLAQREGQVQGKSDGLRDSHPESNRSRAYCELVPRCRLIGDVNAGC